MAILYLLAKQLQVALATNAALATTTRPPTRTAARQYTAAEKAAYEASLDPMGYCWTHGYRVVCGHNSANCKRKLQGHKDNATRDNIMGGSTRGRN